VGPQARAGRRSLPATPDDQLDHDLVDNDDPDDHRDDEWEFETGRAGGRQQPGVRARHVADHRGADPDGPPDPQEPQLGLQASAEAPDEVLEGLEADDDGQGDQQRGKRRPPEGGQQLGDDRR